MAVKGKAPKKEKPKKDERETKKKRTVKEGLRGIVRIAGKDMMGDTKLSLALLRVRGLSHSTAPAASKILAKELSIPPDIYVGEFSDEQIEKIDAILMGINKYFPKYLLNRRADPDEGTDRHLITNDLIFSLRQDIEKDKKLYTWKGYRHSYGQKVRGQRTRNSGRGGMAVGVLRKSIIAAAGGAGAGAAAAAQQQAASVVKEKQAATIVKEKPGAAGAKEKKEEKK